MSRDIAQNAAPIDSVAQLREWIAAGAKGPSARLGIGTEHEKLGFDAATGAPLTYEGPSGIGALLEGIIERFGGEPILDDGRVLGIDKPSGAVTLEPGGQLELSGRVTLNLHETAAEIGEHLQEVATVGRQLGQVWTHLALQPWEDLPQMPWMPKSRYRYMRQYLPTRGALAHWMMQMTCTVQANLDFRHEADAIDLMGTIARVSPLATALMANSPYRLGASAGARSFRMLVWEQTDPDRCGLPEFFFDDAATFDDYVAWALTVPMVFIRRQGAYVDMRGIPFGHFVANGHGEHRANIGDWELHLSTLFPDVRLKRYIETRTTDAADPGRMVAVAALWKGIGYDLDARRAARDLADVANATEGRALSAIAAREGLDGVWKGATLRERAARLIEVAGAGLDRQAVGGEPLERPLLGAFLGADGRPVSPGDALTRVWEACGGDRATVLAAYAIG